VKCSWCQELQPDAVCKFCCTPVHLTEHLGDPVHGPMDCSVERLGEDGLMAPCCNICLCMVCGEPQSGVPFKNVLVLCTQCGARTHQPGEHDDLKSCSSYVRPDKTGLQGGPCRAVHMLKEDAANYQEFVDTHYDTFKVRLDHSSTLIPDYKTIPVNKPRYPHHATFYLLSPSPPTSPTSMTY
jgi:hypothetical protein